MSSMDLPPELQTYTNSCLPDTATRMLNRHPYVSGPNWAAAMPLPPNQETASDSYPSALPTKPCSPRCHNQCLRSSPFQLSSNSIPPAPQAQTLELSLS